MSGLGERVCPLTPRLKELMDSLRSELTDVGVEESSVASLSVSDYPVMDANWFTSNGNSIVERSERIAMKSAVSAFSAGEVGDASVLEKRAKVNEGAPRLWCRVAGTSRAASIAISSKTLKVFEKASPRNPVKR